MTQTDEQASKMRAIRTEIERGHLSPELNDFLVGQRPERTYQDYEGTGRRRHAVTKTYTPESEFVKAERQAHSALEAARKTFRETSRTLEDHERELTGRLAEHAQAREELDNAIPAAGWALGWPGSPEDMPKRPK